MSNNRLGKIGEYQYGDLVPTTQPTTEELSEYIDRFNSETEDTLHEGDVTENYSYYFDQLEHFAQLYPNFDYNRVLTFERSKCLSFFYDIVRRQKIKYNN